MSTLSPEEADSLGLPPVPKRALSPEEAHALGLPPIAKGKGAVLSDMAEKSGASEAVRGAEQTGKDIIDDPAIGRRLEGLVGINPVLGPVVTAGRMARNGIRPTLEQEKIDAMSRAAGVSSNLVPKASGVLKRAGASSLPDEEEFASAVRAAPEQFAAGAFAQPNPFGKVGGVAGVVGRVGFNAASNATAATAGKKSPSLADAEDAAALSLPFSALGEVAGQAHGALNDREKSALESLRSKNEGAIRKDIGSQQGSFGGHATKEERIHARLREMANNPKSPNILEAQRIISTPEFQARDANVERNILEAYPDAAGLTEAAKREWIQSKVNAPGELKSRMEADTKSPLVDSLLPGAKRYAGRTAGTLIGGHIAGPPGAAVGALVSGNPGTWWANRLKDPKFKLGTAHLGQALVSPAEAVTKAVPRTFAEWLAMHDEENKK